MYAEDGLLVGPRRSTRESSKYLGSPHVTKFTRAAKHPSPRQMTAKHFVLKQQSATHETDCHKLMPNMPKPIDAGSLTGGGTFCDRTSNRSLHGTSAADPTPKFNEFEGGWSQASDHRIHEGWGKDVVNEGACVGKNFPQTRTARDKRKVPHTLPNRYEDREGCEPLVAFPFVFLTHSSRILP